MISNVTGSSLTFHLKYKLESVFPVKHYPESKFEVNMGNTL